MATLIELFKKKLEDNHVNVPDNDIDICIDKKTGYYKLKSEPSGEILKLWEAFKEEQKLHNPDLMDSGTKPCE